MKILHLKDFEISICLPPWETPEQAEDRLMDALEPYGVASFTTEIEEYRDEEYSSNGLTEAMPADHTVFGTNYKCGHCGQYLFPAAKFCSACGMAVRWKGDRPISSHVGNDDFDQGSLAKLY